MRTYIQQLYDNTKLYDAANDGAGGDNKGEPKQDSTLGPDGKPIVVDPNANKDGSVFAFDNTVFAELDADSRQWMVQQGLATDKGITPETAAKMAKQVRNQEKLLGSAIRLPGKDATQEERDQFLNKLGRPEKVDGYEFTVPKELPENLPYDGERASGFKAVAHQLGLTKEQAAGIHDWYVGKTVEDFNGSSETQAAAKREQALAETAKLVKVWGPQDSETFKANLELAHRFIEDAGDASVMPELKRLGAVSEDGMILSEPIARLFANAGSAFFKEGEMLRGKRTTLGNPFAEGTKDFNVTQQMLMYKQDPEMARSLIAAAGKKPSDFGLKDA